MDFGFGDERRTDDSYDLASPEWECFSPYVLIVWSLDAHVFAAKSVRAVHIRHKLYITVL